MNGHGISLYDANDVLPVGFTGTPWEIIFNGLRDVLKNNFSDAPGSFIFAACALHYIVKGEYDKVTDPAVLDGLAAALFVPYWVENSQQTERAAAILNLWLSWKPTRENLKSLALASGMRAFTSHEQYTQTEYGYTRSFLFNLGEGARDSFFAVGETDAEKYASICIALYRFIGRLNGAPARIFVGEGYLLNYTAPGNEPLGAKYYLRANQSEIRLLYGYNWDLFNADGTLAYSPDEYAVFIPSVVRDTYGNNTEITPPSEFLILDDGQVRLSWKQSPASAYAVYCQILINIPDKTRAWLNVDHTDMNLPPNAIPGVTLLDDMGDPISGEYEIFAAYGSNCVRLDSSAMYLAGTDPVRLRSSAYVHGINQVWLESLTPPPPPPPEPVYGFIIVNETTGEIESGEQLEELLLSPVGTLMMSDTPMLLIPDSVYNTTPLYFTNNGAAETNNTTLILENALYFADGTRTKNSEVTSLATKPFAFMDKDNQFFMGTNSDELFEMTAVNAGLRCLGASSSIGKAALLALFEPKNEEVTAYFRVEGSAYEYDTQINQGGGNNLYDASGNSLYYDSSRIYTVVALYNASNELQPCGNGDKIDSNSGYLRYSRGTTLSRAYAHHLVFKQTIPPPPSVLSAYFTNQGAAGTSDTNVTFGTFQMYDSSGSVIYSDSAHTYTFVKAYNYSGNEVAVPGTFSLYNNSGTLCMSFAPTNIDVYKITYTVS